MNRTAYRLAPALDQRGRRRAPSGTRSEPEEQARGGEGHDALPRSAELAGERAQPAAGGGEDDVADAAAGAGRGRARRDRPRPPRRIARAAAATTCRRGPRGRSPRRRASGRRRRAARPRGGSRISTARTWWRAGDGGERGPPVARAAEVGHDDDEAAARRAHAATNRRAAAGERGRDRGPSLEAGLDAAWARAAAPSSPRRPAAGGTRRSARPPNVDDPEPVAALRGEVAERDRDALGDVGLAPVGRPERHRRRDVEEEPGRERALRRRGRGRAGPSSGR